MLPSFPHFPQLPVQVTSPAALEPGDAGNNKTPKQQFILRPTKQQKFKCRHTKNCIKEVGRGALALRSKFTCPAASYLVPLCVRLFRCQWLRPSPHYLLCALDSVSSIKLSTFPLIFLLIRRLEKVHLPCSACASQSSIVSPTNLISAFSPPLPSISTKKKNSISKFSGPKSPRWDLTWHHLMISSHFH